LLIGDRCGAHTFPYIVSKNPSAVIEHEATTSKVSDDQLFLCQQRGLDAEKAVSMIVNGFCREVFKELPMEFAVDAAKLLEVSLEGSVGCSHPLHRRHIAQTTIHPGQIFSGQTSQDRQACSTFAISTPASTVQTFSATSP